MAPSPGPAPGPSTRCALTGLDAFPMSLPERFAGEGRTPRIAADIIQQSAKADFLTFQRQISNLP